jgi:hypothetical protein
MVVGSNPTTPTNRRSDINIFILDNDPVIAAQYQCDKHVVKMVLESAQMLSTCHILVDDNKNPMLYRATHKNHPCNVWLRESKDNYKWLYDHFVALSKEYTYRYDKWHKSYRKLGTHLWHVPIGLPDVPRTKFAMGMKQYPQCIVEDPVESYRNYYRVRQQEIDMRWSKRSVPDWI